MNTLKNISGRNELRRQSRLEKRWGARRSQSWHRALLLKRADDVEGEKAPKTILHRRTAAGMKYLEDRGLANFDACRLTVDTLGGFPRLGV